MNPNTHACFKIVDGEAKERIDVVAEKWRAARQAWGDFANKVGAQVSYGHRGMAFEGFPPEGWVSTGMGYRPGKHLDVRCEFDALPAYPIGGTDLDDALGVSPVILLWATAHCAVHGLITRHPDSAKRRTRPCSSWPGPCSLSPPSDGCE